LHETLKQTLQVHKDDWRKKKTPLQTQSRRKQTMQTQLHTPSNRPHTTAGKIENERTPEARSEKNNGDEKQRCMSFMQQSRNCPHLPETASTANRVDENPTARLPVHRPPTRAA
jgi:hypothetical protein